MKNIYIIGVPRTGKTTFSKLLKSKYPVMNVISFEALRNGFIKTLPELNMGNRNSKARKEILPDFLVEFAKWNSTISNFGSIIEGDFCDIKTLKELTNEDVIICLGFGKKSLDEVIDGIKAHDKADDYTKEWSLEKLKNHFYDIVEKDEENYNFCNDHNIPYFDTFDNREEVFSNILNFIENQFQIK